MTRWFEDITIGDVFALGEHEFTQDEIIRFGTLYDPQYFHIDPELARHSHFGGIIASGWHTVSVGHRIMVDALDAEAARMQAQGLTPGVSGPSPGVNSMEFKVPVRPGDKVRYQLEVTGKRHSNSIPGWGLLFNRISATNQRDELVYRAELVSFSKRRDYVMPLRLKLLQALTKLPLIGPMLKRGS